MGTNVSTQIQENIIRNVSINSSQIVQNIATSNYNKFGLNQHIELSITEDAVLNCGGGLQLTNKGESSQSGMSRLTAEQFAQIAQDIQTNFITSATAELEQANQEFNFFQGNIATTVQKAVTDTRVENYQAVEQSISQTVSQTTSVQQLIVVRISERGSILVAGDCIFSNDITVTMVTENATAALQDSVLQSDIAQELVQALDDAVTQKNKGVNLTLIFIIIGVVVGLGLIAGLTVYFVKKKKK